jgi:triacylglycerol lipase
MSALGLIEAGEGLRSPAPITLPELTFEEGLAIGRRIWLRGRLSGAAFATARNPQVRPGASRSQDNGSDHAHVESRLSGHVFENDVAVRNNGEFETLLHPPLPLARRGWRIARNRVTYSGQTIEKCAVVLTAPEHAGAATVVLLPSGWSLQSYGLQKLASSPEAAALAPVLRALHDDPSSPSAIYYVIAVTDSNQVRQAELALATTTLGWPGGSFVLMHAEPGQELQTLRTALDRLRWLAADAFDVRVLNLEPALKISVSPKAGSTGDRASVTCVVNAGENPWNLLETHNRAPSTKPLVVPRPSRSYLIPRHPVVFCHGMLAFTTLNMQTPENHNCFSSLRDFLDERGYRAFYPQVAPTSGVAARAEELCDQIRSWTDEPINLVAHSMGGLDARYLIARLGMAKQVCTLTTIATPHRGTALVDWFIKNYRNRVPLLLALEAIGMNVDGFADCRPVACAEFNAKTPDAPGVRYFSFGGAVSSGHVTPVLRRAWSLLSALEGPNDGMVSVASARWGEYLGTLHADHFAQTPDMTFVRPNEDFDTLAFYSRLLEDLARRGF